MKTPKGYLKLGEAAKRLGITYRSLSDWIKKKKVKSFKPGKERFILITELERFQ